MNKLNSFIVICFLFLFGCSHSFEVNTMVLTSVYDFTTYSDKGFLFTPEQYLYDYESRGQITIEIIPEVRESSYNEEVDDTWRKQSGKTFWKVKIFNPQEVLDELYKKAISMGADAVVRLKFDTNEHFNGAIFFNSLVATGFAIQRKNK